ncbi:MAG: hypothetical protein AAF197_07335 [Pseudomonadota bacterium]
MHCKGWKTSSKSGTLYCINRAWLTQTETSGQSSDKKRLREEIAIHNMAELLSGSLLESSKLSVASNQLVSDLRLPTLDFQIETNIEAREGQDQRWLRLRHHEYAEFAASLPAVTELDTRMTTRYMYLAGVDGDNYLKLLSQLAITTKVIDPDKVSKRSLIKAYRAFDPMMLLISFYEGREFWHRVSEDRATIVAIKRNQPFHTTYVQETPRGLYRGTLALEKFAERFCAYPQSEGSQPNYDVLRYAETGIHKLTPDTEDSEYIEALDYFK